MSKIHAELNNQSLNGTSSQEITRTTVGTKNGLHIYDISAKAFIALINWLEDL